MKYKPSALPSEEADVETHVTQALDTYWSVNNGDWTGLIKNIEVTHSLFLFVYDTYSTQSLKDDLLTHTDEQSQYIKQAVDLTNLLSQDRIISLIIQYGDKSYLPKLDRNKHEGKFLKGDYIAGTYILPHSLPLSHTNTHSHIHLLVVFLDIMRELNGNNYRTVCEQLEKETKKGNLEVKKGFK